MFDAKQVAVNGNSSDSNNNNNNTNNANWQLFEPVALPPCTRIRIAFKRNAQNSNRITAGC